MATATDQAVRPIIVKFVVTRPRRYAPERWLRQFPGGEPIWGRCRFVFDADAREYDWLVAYDGLPADRDDGSKKGREILACARAHTLLLTAEPSSIKHYGRRFVAQFGCVLTSQDASALPHPNAIRSQPALHWFYGLGKNRLWTYDEIRDHPPLAKTGVISSVASSKQHRHTIHRRRYLFTQELKVLLPELEVFGRGVREIDDKAEALDAFRYHVAVENHVGQNHWTEKLADPFLGCCLPFYFGCPNAADYFPEGSFIPIDIFDPPGAARIIRAAIENNEYERRLPLILEARRRVLYEYNTFAVVSRLIEARHSAVEAKSGVILFSRHALRAASPLNMAADVFDKIRGKLAAFKSAR